MTHYLKKLAAICLGLGLFAIGGTTQAQTVSDTFEIRLTIEEACTVTAGAASDIDLGTVPATATDITGTNSIVVNCSNTTPYFIGLLPSNSARRGCR